MTSVQNTLDKIDELITRGDFDNGDYDLAFQLSDNIIRNPKASETQITEAIFTKGLVVAMICPYLTEYEEDDTGLIYFQEVVKRDPHYLSALLNILTIVKPDGINRPYLNRAESKQSFIKAYDTLQNELYDQLDESHKSQLQKMQPIYQKFKRSLE